MVIPLKTQVEPIAFCDLRSVFVCVCVCGAFVLFMSTHFASFSAFSCLFPPHVES